MKTDKLERISNVIRKGAFIEALSGALAIILTTLGLLHLASTNLVSVATIALGIGIFLQGTAIATEYSNLNEFVDEKNFKRFNLGTGLSFEILAGGIVFALGILAMGFAPINIFTPIASIVLGMAITLSSRTLLKIDDFKTLISESGMPVDSFARETIDATFGIQIVIGLAAITLGVLSLDGISTLLLTTIAFLSLGFSILLNGLAISGRLSGATSH
ncbi:MAG TPA: hypothetical protein VJ964_08465 [Balneolaceae bacterium]|nr:hypothetical protein [Balneolaceae bacterium]